MGETLQQFPRPIEAPDGTRYEARACGTPMSGGTWQGWIEFVPLDGGAPVRTPRETTQPNRTDTAYWATGLSDVYLEGALRRALEPHAPPPVPPPGPSVFAGPAETPLSPTSSGASSILDPFSVYEKGEALLRKQLAALSAWHLVNIIVDYELSDQPVEALNSLPAATLIETIVDAVRRQATASHLR